MVSRKEKGWKEGEKKRTHLNCKRNKERSTGQSEQLKQDNGGVKALVFAVFPHQKALKWNEFQQDTGDPSRVLKNPAAVGFFSTLGWDLITGEGVGAERDRPG